MSQIFFGYRVLNFSEAVEIPLVIGDLLISKITQSASSPLLKISTQKYLAQKYFATLSKKSLSVSVACTSRTKPPVAIFAVGKRLNSKS